MKNFRNKQFINIKLCTVLSSELKPCAVQLCPAWDADHRFVQPLHAIHTVQYDLSENIVFMQFLLQKVL